MTNLMTGTVIVTVTVTATAAASVSHVSHPAVPCHSDRRSPLKALAPAGPVLPRRDSDAVTRIAPDRRRLESTGKPGLSQAGPEQELSGRRSGTGNRPGVTGGPGLEA